MADYQRIVEFLRDIRQGSLQSVTEEITQAAAEYAQLCEAANERLRKCSTYLQQGLRTEAIHLAEEPPNLLDLVAALDLPDPQVWSEYCQNNGLAVAPPLQLDRAAQLNEAYAADQPLEHLMAEHRLLALARAPVGQRLDVMRKISAIEPGNANWEKDLRIFETARIKELPSAFLNAVRNKDESAIGGLMTEVTQNSWYETLPADLVSGVTDAFNRMQRAHVEAQLQEMVPALRDAYAARSFKECQAMAQVWKNKMAAAGVTTISQELLDEIRPVVAFVAEQEKREEYLKKFRNSCKAFEGMLDRDATDAELEMGYSKLKQFNEPIPEPLTQRYQNKDAQRQKNIERSHKLRLVGIALTVGAILVISLITVYVLMRQASARNWAHKIAAANALHSADGIAQANAYIAELHKENPGFLSESEVASAVRDTSTLQIKMDSDRNVITGLEQKIDALMPTAGPTATNEAATPEETLTAAAAAQELLDQVHAAGDLAWADTDKRYAADTIQLQDIFNKLSARASSSIRTELDNLSTKLDGIVPGSETAEADLTAINDRLAQLSDLKGLDDSTKSSVAALIQKIGQQKESFSASRDMAGDLANIRQSVDSTEDWQKALAAFVQKYPTDPRTSDFSDALTRANSIKELDGWRAITDKWGENLAPPSSVAAQQRIDVLTNYVAANPDSPITDAAARYGAYLKQASNALAANGTWQAATADPEFLADPVLSKLSYMETSDHHRYFVLGDIKRVDRRLADETSVSFDVVDPHEVTKRVQVTIDPPLKLLTPEPVPTEQAKLCQGMIDEIRGIDEKNWDTWGIDAIEKVAHEEKVNVAVRAAIVQKLIAIQMGMTGWALGDTYDRTTVDLARQNLDKTSWVDESLLSDITKSELNKILAGLPAAADVKKKLVNAKQRMFQKAAFNVTATGVLLKNDNGDYITKTKGDLLPGGEAFVVMAAPPAAAAAPDATPPAAAPADATAPATDASQPAPAPTPAAPPANPTTLLHVGSVNNGELDLDQKALRGVPVGSLVFVTKPDK